MEAAGFVDFAISSNTCHSPLWTGMHLECTARKELDAGPNVDSEEFVLKRAPREMPVRAS